MRYETILFDADGTLLDFHRSEAEAISETMRASKIEPSDALISAYSEINADMWKRLERGEIKKSELLYLRFAVFCERFGFDADFKKMAEDYISNLSSKGYAYDGAEELCQRLSNLCSLYIVTNGVERIQKGRFAKLSLKKYFKNVFISGEIGYEKPDVRFFDEVARRIGALDKKKTLIVGDSLTSDMAGGIAFGIDTCLYAPKGKPEECDMDITYVAQSFDEIYGIIVGEEA